MIHYHGCDITPRSVLLTLAGRHFCHSYARPFDVEVCHQIGQGNMLDNGAFAVWQRKIEPDWRGWREWVEPYLDYHTTWAVLPDAVDGGEEANDRLLREWPVERGAPVWHLDEPISRLLRLCSSYERVCFGSASVYSTIGSPAWHRRMTEAFDAICDPDGRVPVWTHMLRGMQLAGGPYPFASVDSTDIARNHKRPWNNAAKMADRWDAVQCPARWTRVDQLTLEEVYSA